MLYTAIAVDQSFWNGIHSRQLQYISSKARIYQISVCIQSISQHSISIFLSVFFRKDESFDSANKGLDSWDLSTAFHYSILTHDLV